MHVGWTADTVSVSSILLCILQRFPYIMICILSTPHLHFLHDFCVRSIFPSLPLFLTCSCLSARLEITHSEWVTISSQSLSKCSLCTPSQSTTFHLFSFSSSLFICFMAKQAEEPCQCVDSHSGLFHSNQKSGFPAHVIWFHEQLCLASATWLKKVDYSHSQISLVCINVCSKTAEKNVPKSMVKISFCWF